jgi:hypothetical protein
MQDQPINDVEAHPQRRPAIWPWLLIPLVTLVLFYALQRVRDTALERAGPTHSTSVHPAQDSSSP